MTLVSHEKRSLYQTYASEFENKYLLEPAGQRHLAMYEKERDEVKQFWSEIKQAKERGVEFVEHPIASYSVAIIVNAANPLSNLTRDQVRDIFTGTVKNWKEVGGPDASIHLDIRDPISGTYLGFRELAMENQPHPAGTNAFTSYAAMVQAVAQDANAVGYASLDLIQSPGIKSLSIGGVAPANSSVNDGKYPYARLLRFYTIKGKEAPGTFEFIKFVQSPKGQRVVAQSGNVPRL